MSFAFDNHLVFDGINLTVDNGEFVYLVGETGSGKTTLMRLIYMDLLPTRGVVKVEDFSSNQLKRKKLYLLRRKLGIIFQDFKLLDDRSVYANVVFSLHAAGFKGKEIDSRAIRALNLVGLVHKKEAEISELSGGEQQRLAIARAIAKDPVAILADEPTGNLDPVSSAETISLLKEINLNGTSVFLATHNHELIRKFPARTISIKNYSIEELRHGVSGT
ncbi:MAG: cell division ATP-binding protein FtsE [Candidatus Kryptoniota bacterium]